MKLNLILFTSAGNKSGGSRQALYLAEGMAERGHNVAFFVPKGSELPELAPRASFWREFSGGSGWRGQIEAAMPKHGPCVVHAFHNAAVKRAAWWGLFWKKRAVMVAHRGVIFRPNNPLPYWSPGIDRFLVNSRACARVLRGIGLSARRIEYVPNAVPDSRLSTTLSRAEFRRELGIPEDALLLLCIGGNKPYKGITELIQAFARAFPAANRRDGLPHLVVIGLSESLWQPLVEQLGLGGRIHCLGRREDVGNFLAASDAFVLPSLSESMPNTLLEAVRAHLPCIGTTVGAVPDILGEEPACGLLTPPGDAQSLAEALQRLADDAGLRETLAANARIQADRYRPEKRLDLVEGIYRDLLRQKGLV